MSIQWDDLRYLLAIHRSGTLSRAAAELDVARTTVGRRLRALEEQLGVRLFDRTPEGFFTTAAGEDLVDTAERVEEELLAAEGRLIGQDGELRGPLHVSTLDYLWWAHAALFKGFRERYPSIDLTIRSTPELVSLTRREADVALRLTAAPDEGLFGRKVGAVDFAVYGSRDLVEQIDGDAYSAYPWLGVDGEQSGRWLHQWLAANAPRAEVVLRLDESAIARRQALRAGIGVFFLPTFEGDAMPELQRLGPVHFTRSLWVLTLPELWRTARVRAFLRHIAEGLRS